MKELKKDKIRIVATGSWKQNISEDRKSTGRVVLAEFNGIKFGTRERVLKDDNQVLDLFITNNTSPDIASKLLRLIKETDYLKRPAISKTVFGLLWIYCYLPWKTLTIFVFKQFFQATFNKLSFRRIK